MSKSMGTNSGNLRAATAGKAALFAWLRAHDPDLVALRRGARAAVIMPIIFFIANMVIHRPTFTLFAAFGSVATLLLVSFSGSKRDHLVEAGAMILAELVLVCLGTLVSTIPWLAIICTVLITFGIYFLSILKPSLGKATNSLLASFLLPVTVPASVHAVPERFLGWLLAGTASLLAIVYLWPVTKRAPVNEVTFRVVWQTVQNIKAEVMGDPARYIPRMRHAVRTSVALGAAVLVASLLSASHAFWVVLSTLTVICTSEINTGQRVERALIGTIIGIIFAGGLIAVIDTNIVVCWILLPFAVFFAGFAAVAFSFVAGQIAFTTLLLLISNITTPIGWQIGIVRIEDMCLGCIVSLLVGAVFWPRSSVRTPSLAHHRARR